MIKFKIKGGFKLGKLYSKYTQLKKENPNILYVFKSGVFYIFIDEDAKKISQLLNLKLTKLNDSIFKCGFPISAQDKYFELLKQIPYEINIIENINNISSSTNSLITDNSIKNLVKKIQQINIDSLPLKDTYSLIKNIKEYANKIKL